MAHDKVDREISVALKESSPLSDTTFNLLDLPLEIRELIYSEVSGPHKVFYLRSLGSSTAKAGYWNYDTTWRNNFDWKNACPQLLLVNKQIRGEALKALLHSGVLDIWGTMTLHQHTSVPKAIGEHVKNVAVVSDRAKDFIEIFPHLYSIEKLFIDSVVISADTFAVRYAMIRGLFTSGCSLSTLCRALRENNIRINIAGVEFEVYRAINTFFGRANTIDKVVYVRCTTFLEETVLAIRNAGLAQVHRGVVPRFEHKFRRTMNLWKGDGINRGS